MSINKETTHKGKQTKKNEKNCLMMKENQSQT